MSNRESTMTAPGQVNFRGYIAELDGLRAVGLSLVLLDHFWPQGMSIYVFQLGNLGWIAMDSFFVMSGFLITGILLDSREKPNYYGTYYARRSLRIFPLYYLVLLIWYCIIRFTNGGADYRSLLQHWGSPAWFTFYAGNIRQAMVGTPPKTIGNNLILGYAPLWSLQVEEQFYLLFPLAVAWLRREHLRWVLIGAIILSPVFRILLYLWSPNNPFLQYVELPCHCEGLALGALIAIRFRSGPWKISKPALTVWTALLMGAACAGSLISTWGTRNQAWGSTWDRLPGYSISSAGCACLVLWLITFRGSSYTRWLRIAPMRYLGKISYGVYLLHPLAMWTTIELVKKHVFHFRNDDPRYFFVGIAMSLAFAALSWHFFEGPLMRVKNRITHYRGPMATAAAGR
jgi:peptidoglycan/LPS O-acetylase OafA/YrhL